MRKWQILWDIVIGALFSIGVFIILCSTSEEISALVSWDKSMFGLGVGIIALSVGAISMKTSNDSDKKMKAMAKLEFHEKIAVIEGYISDIYCSRLNEETSAAKKERIRKEVSKANAKRIYHDIKGAKQLKKYTEDPILIEKLDQEIDNLKTIASKQRTQYKELIDKLNRLKQEDSAQK